MGHMLLLQQPLAVGMGVQSTINMYLSIVEKKMGSLLNTIQRQRRQQMSKAKNFLWYYKEKTVNMLWLT